MIRLLVIDADANFLADLEQRLAPQRSAWEMAFAPTAEAATELGDGTWDVIVADVTLRLDDVTVLEAAKRAQPAAVRIALAPAGNSVPDLTTAHQLLPRGCDAAILRSTVLRSVELRSRLTDPRVLELLGSLPSLPSPSTAMVELRQALDVADVDLRRVGRTVASDIAMGTKLLQVVNSSYYGLSRTVEDPAEGVRLLGARLTGELLLTVGLLDAVASRGSGVDAQLTAMRERSIARADLAATLAERAGRAPMLVRRVWNGAFLLDVGEMLLAGTEHESDPEMVALRTTIGGALLEMWGLPHHLVEVVALSDLAPERSTPEAVHYAWLAAEFSARREAASAATPDGEHEMSSPAAQLPAGQHPADPELVSSVLRWAGLASIDLSDLVPQPVAPRLAQPVAVS